MDLETKNPVLESVGDNEEIATDSVSAGSGNVSESKVQNNGSCVVENSDDNHNELFPEVKRNGSEVLGYVNEPPVGLKPEVSPSPTVTRKGHGLKKWRRIRRDSNRVVDGSVDTGKMMPHELSNPGVSSSKRVQYAERKPRSEGSVSSTDAVLRSLDGFAPLDDLGLWLGTPFAAGTDSENSEDRSSRSSTAASAPKVKYDVTVESPNYNSWMRSSSGKNLTHSGQRGQQGKGPVEATKKARGERVKIEKENSHSSLESDSRSSNFVFMQGTHSTDNGIRNGRPKEYDGDEVQGSGQATDGHQGGYNKVGEGGYDDFSHEDVVADSSWEAKEEKNENIGSLRDRDPLVESVFALDSAQEALNRELLKFKEIVEGISLDDSESELCTEFIDVEQRLQKTSSENLSSGEGIHSFTPAVESEVLQTANRHVETEAEDLFKLKIEAEVEYLVISKEVQKLKVAAMDQITVLEEQKALASEQKQILDKLGNAENKAKLLKKEAENLKFFCEDIAIADETLKLQKKVFQYSSCFFLQVVLLVVILGIFKFKFSSHFEDVVPT